jgi:hypothetical protein
MKKSAIILSTLAGIVLLGACEKNSFFTSNHVQVPTQAQLKVNFVSIYRGLPPFQIKVNDVRVSNTITNTASTAITPFPGGGLNTGGLSTADYLSINPGSNKISISIPKVGTDVDSVALATATIDVAAGNQYSLYFSDTAANTTSLLVQDTLSRPDSAFAKYKFINLIPDLPSADLYIGTTKVASAIPYKGVSPTFLVPTNSSSTTWGIRAAGGTTNLNTYASAASVSNQRVYTVIAKGYSSISATADPRRRHVSLIYNR